MAQLPSTTPQSRRGVFLDRDGTLNVDPGYLNDPNALALFPGVPATLRRLQDAGFALFIVSNQSGIGRGKITEPQLEAIHARLDGFLADAGVRVTGYGICRHHPDEDCECRKPKPKLVLDLAAKHGIDLSRSYMVGDKVSDVECGLNARCRKSFLVLTGTGATESKVIQQNVASLPSVRIVQDLAEAAAAILADRE